MSAPRPSPAATAAVQNPSAAPSPPPPRAREEGELSSGADDDEALQARFSSPSNVGKYVDSGPQAPPATFPGRGINSLTVSNVMGHKTTAASYKKTMRVNQGQFKPGTNRNLTWQKPVSSDNLVITFSDDDSGNDSGKTKQDRVRDRKVTSQDTQKTGKHMQTGIMRQQASRQKTHGGKIGSTNFPAFASALRNAGSGRVSGTTFIRREPPMHQVKSKKKDGDAVGASSAHHSLESLRHKIAAREIELKGQKRPMVAVATKKSDFSSDQQRPSSEKIGFESSAAGECSHHDSLFDHDGRQIKRLKLNQQNSYNQARTDLVILAPHSSSSGKNNMQSSEVVDHFENGTVMNYNIDETEQRVIPELSSQIQQCSASKNLPSSRPHDKGAECVDNHATAELCGMLAAAGCTSGQVMPEDTNALVPVASEQARQRPMPISTSTVLNRPHLHPGEENCSGQIPLEGQSTGLLSLLEMEELQERELEDAQEHRRKCEVEEREALRAYRKAQRALLEANERCIILRRKREMCSAQVHSYIADGSSLVHSLSTKNAGDGLAKPPLLNSQIHADCRLPESQGCGYSHPEVPPQQPVDKHESQPHYRDELAVRTTDPNFVTTVDDNSMPSDFVEDDLNLPDRQARSECALDMENHTEETIHVYAQENRQASGDSAQFYELLEASLRSRLVERFGKKPCVNSTGENTELAGGEVAGAEHDKQPANAVLQLEEPEQNVMETLEGTMVHGNDSAEKTGGLSNSNSGPSTGNCDPEDNISYLRELCMPLSTNCPIFPSSALQSAARHVKYAFPRFCEASGFQNDHLSYEAASEATESTEHIIHGRARENTKMHPTIQKDNATDHTGIDPFWPYCMFELRGKCNDEECQWQHAENYAWRKSMRRKHATTSVSGQIPHDLFQHALPVPAYRVGLNLIKADLNLTQSVLASSLWQYWQRGFCASFPLPLSVQRVLPSDAPSLQGGDSLIADFDTNRKLLNFRMLDGKKTKIIQGSVDVEFFLEASLCLYCGRANKPDRIKALLLLARAIEADPSIVILWVFYLHIYYQKDEGLGKDDMFSDAVQHNVYSYELWLMYINSRLRFDDRLDAYNDALSMLCQMTADSAEDLKERSAFILDIFLQMIYFLCMSGNVERGISRIFGILPTATPDICGDKLLADIISCLTISDRCIFWTSCLYVSMYRKLPEEIIDQLEFQKALPRALVWPPIEPSTDNRSQIIELLKYAADKMAIDISESVKDGDPSYLMLSQFLVVNHVSCLAVLEGFKSSANMLVKYMEEYPMCPQILLMSARLQRRYGTYPGLKGFDELLLDWPKEVQGIQYLWNQYIELALADSVEFAEKVLTSWFEKYGEGRDLQSNVAVGTVEISTEATGQPLLASAQETDSGPSLSEDEVFRSLNLSLYKMLENNLHEAHVCVDKAMRSAHGEYYEHCLREHAAIHTLAKPPCPLDAQTCATFSLVIGYLADHKNLPTRDLLSRRFCQNIKKQSLKQLIDDTIGPVSVDSSVINSVLEACFGPSLLPAKIGKVKYLVDFVESVIEVLPANYRLALAVGRFVVKHYEGADPTSTGTKFWASSVLVNAIFRAVPVAPESAWLEGANLLEKLHVADTVKRFYQQATSVYPFSYKLWHAYLNTCKAGGSNTEGIIECARQRGIELSLT